MFENKNIPNQEEIKMDKDLMARIKTAIKSNRNKLKLIHENQSSMKCRSFRQKDNPESENKDNTISPKIF